MRALLATPVAVAVLAACLPDRGSGFTSSRDAGADATAAERPTYECDGPIDTGLVAAFSPAEPADYVAWRMEYFNGGDGPPPSVTVYDDHGAPSDIARSMLDATRICDAEKCPATEWPYMLRGDGAWGLYCHGTASVGGLPAGGYNAMVLAVARGNAVSLLTRRDDLVSFFGTIDTKAEAAYLAIRDGFLLARCNYGGIEEREEGFAIRIPVRGGCERAPDGPKTGSEEIVLVVGRDGRTRIESRRLLPAGMLGEAE